MIVPLIGAFIRKKRLEKNYSQQGLCQGICVVSYLSKIEQGVVNPSDEIVSALFHRLGCVMEFGDICSERLKERIEIAYQQIFEEGFLPQEQENEEFSFSELERLEEGPFFIDALLLKAFYFGRDLPDILQEYGHLMGQVQQVLFLLLTQKAKTAVQRMPCGYTFFAAGVQSTIQGEYVAAVRFLEQGFQYSSQECSIVLMAKSKLFLGICYSELQQWEDELQAYRCAQKIIQYIHKPWVQKYYDIIQYNIGATLLHRGRLEQAYAALQKCKGRKEDFCHKMAICLEKMGEKEKAMEWVQKGFDCLAQASQDNLYWQRLQLVEIRLQHHDYLKYAQYEALLNRCVERLRNEFPAGYLRFEIPWVIELLESQRKYKEVSQLLKEFSCIF